MSCLPNNQFAGGYLMSDANCRPSTRKTPAIAGVAGRLAGGGWATRQETLRQWRNAIWEGAGQPAGQQVYLRWHRDFLERFYQPPQDRQSAILDVGCGYMLKNFQQAGMLDQLLRRLGGRYTGIDPIDEWFDIAADCPVRLCRGMGEHLPWDDASFDAALNLGVLDHTLRPKRVLAEIHRVVKPGGILWFANSFAAGSRLRVLWAKLAHRLGLDKNHRFVWTPRDLQRLVAAAGFTIVRTDYCRCDASFYIHAMRKSGKSNP